MYKIQKIPVRILHIFGLSNINDISPVACEQSLAFCCINLTNNVVFIILGPMKQIMKSNENYFQLLKISARWSKTV